MSMEIEVRNITAFDNVNGQGIMGSVDFIDYNASHERVNINVIIPLDKEASIYEVEGRIMEKAKQQLKALVSGF